jgi:60 kDa SS-A/Ro ribonucleoprotein
LNASDDVPQAIKTALHRAAEHACGNVPVLSGPIIIGVDVSGSMQCAVTGDRGRGATTKMRCVDVAALVAAAILRRNPESIVVPFDTSAYQVRIDPSDSILSLAERLAQYGGGGTDCAQPIVHANRVYAHRKFAGIVLVSDNESWVYQGRPYYSGNRGTTGVVEQWQQFVQNQVRLQAGDIAGPKLICIDLQPGRTTQAPDRSDILNVGGFSDAVFEVIAAFLENDSARFVSQIEAIPLQ